jgi:hypothetical protein
MHYAREMRIDGALVLFDFKKASVELQCAINW